MDLNCKRHPDWQTYATAYPSARQPFQTYLIHSQNNNRGTGEDRWWAYQSNVLGVVIAENSLSEDVICSYPRALGEIVEHFIPDVVIAETDFETADTKIRRSPSLGVTESFPHKHTHTHTLTHTHTHIYTHLYTHTHTP